MPDDKQSFLQKAKTAVNKVYLDATNKLVMDRPSYGRDQSEKRVAVEMSRRQGEQEYWDYLKRNSADEFYKQASVNLGQTSGPRPMDAVTQGISQVAESREAPGWLQTGLRYAPLAGQVAMSVLSKGEAGFPRINEEPMPMPAPGMRLNVAPGKAMEIAKAKAVAPGGAPAGDLGELETGLQASAKRMFPSVEERTAGTQIGDAIAARKAAAQPAQGPMEKAGLKFAHDSSDPVFEEPESAEKAHIWKLHDEQGNRVGHIIATESPKDAKVLNINAVELNKEYQGKGIGSQMYDKFIGDAREKGYKAIRSDVRSEQAQKVWDKLRTKHNVVEEDMGRPPTSERFQDLRLKLDPHSEVLNSWTKSAFPPEQ